MAIFENFLDSFNRIRNKVEEFKSDHKMANTAISKIIQSMPSPFDKFLGIVWNGLEKDEDSPKQILEMLEKFNTQNEILFIQQTQKISEILDKKPDKKDIIQLSEEIRNSKISIEKLLDDKLAKLTSIAEMNSKKLDKVLENQTKLKLTGIRGIQENKEAVIRLNYVGEEGNRYLEKKQFSIARALFQIILDKEPKNVNAINNIALTYYLQDDFIEAEKWYKKGFEAKPNDLHVLNDYYMTLLAQEKENEALILIMKLLENDSEDLIALYNKGVIQYHQDQYNEAIITLDKVIQKQPNNAGAWANKGSAYLGLEDFGNALTCLDKALSIEEFSMALNNKALTLSKQGDILEAKKLFKKSLKLEPENPNTLYNFGVLLYDNKEVNDAMELFDKVPLISSDFVQAMFAKGRIFLENNQFEKARVCYDRILESDSENSDAFAHRGLSYVMNGKMKEGLDDFNTALNIDPTNYVASENLKRIQNNNITSDTKWSIEE